MEILKHIEVDESSRIPKYQQVVDSIIYNISMGKLLMNQKIPSINMLCEEFYLSRDTIQKGYNILMERNIIRSVRGKGYYVAETKLMYKRNILFLINKLSSYKLSVYNSFVNTIGPNSKTSLRVYHCDETLFLNILEKNNIAYDYYVIMPHFKTENFGHITFTEKVYESLSHISNEKLILLDNSKPGLDEGVTEIYQDFENDIYFALKEAHLKIAKYKKCILIFPNKTVYPYPKRILHGFRKFCVENNINFEVIYKVYDDMILKAGESFITIEETDLVDLVKKIREDEFVLGKDIGVISYNDTPLKELLGITVISTNFKLMGETTANMILNMKKGKVKVPFNFIDRGSV